MKRGLSTEMDGFYNWETQFSLETWTHCQLILKPLHFINFISNIIRIKQYHPLFLLNVLVNPHQFLPNKCVNEKP